MYLRGASRADLPPYGLTRGVHDLALVEGFFDYHQLQARGVENVAALGGTSTSSRFFERLAQLGVRSVTMCLDNDDAGRAATAKAVEHSARARTSPAIYVVAPDSGAAKDPDLLVREEGVERWRELLEQRRCGIVWRTGELVRHITSDAPVAERREALRHAGVWLGTLPRRLALEQEDAVQLAAGRCGYSPEATQRAFHQRFFRDMTPSRNHALTDGSLEHRTEADIEI